MNRTHATVIAVLLGLAAALGLFAAFHTVHLSGATRQASAARLAAQQRQLIAAEHALRVRLAQHSAPAAPTTAPKTVFVRPAPIIVHLHRHGGDGEGDGGFDD